jgi:putative phosphoesterase
MKIALIGDIHSNIHALTAVMAHAKKRGVQRFINTGDFVGYGAFPDEVVQAIRDSDTISIRGNYDQKVLEFKEKKKKWRDSKHDLKWLAFEYAWKNLSKGSRRYLRSLPLEQDLKLKRFKIHLTHGSPASDEEPLTPKTPIKRLKELNRMLDTDLVICGHSHQPFTRQAGPVLYINPGSVGRPDDGDPRASYAILSIKGKLPKVKFFRVKYKVKAAAEAIAERDLPHAFCQMILRGRDLETILAGG